MITLKTQLRVVSVVLFLGALPARASILQSGVYEGLMLAVSSGGTVTGYYSESLDEGVKRTCAFYLAGATAKSDEAQITSWSSIQLPGRLTASANGVTLTIPDGQTHAGCINVLLPEINSGVELEVTQKTHWVSLAEAVNPQVWFYAKPDTGTRRNAWIVKGDVVGVIQMKAEWTQIQYVSHTGKTTTGWVSSGEVKALTPPVS